MARNTTLAAATALALALVACQSAAPAAPTPAQAPAIVVPSPSPVMLMAAQMGVADPAVTASLWGNAATTNRDLELARGAGLKWIKQQFEWRNIEPEAKGQLQWTETDRIVDAIGAARLKIIARVDDQPKWAASGVAFPSVGPPENSQDFTDFLTAMATRYKGRIQAYEIWDEPNVASRWADRRPDPGEYTRMLRAAYTAIKAVDPQALVVSAALLPTTRYDETVVPDLVYLRSMYGANARGGFDVLGVDARGYKAQPCADPQQVAEDPALTNNDESLPVEGRRIYAFRHVEDVRMIMADRGDGNKPIGILDMGWTTDTRADAPDSWHAVSEQEQASYLTDAIRCARENWSPWIGFMTVDSIADPHWTLQDAAYWLAITTPDGQPRPAYTALKSLFGQ